MSDLPLVVTCTPSRGLMHSRTAEAIHQARLYAASMCRDDLWLFSHDAPIPDAHEELAESAFSFGADFVWFVEEDVIPGIAALGVLLRHQRQTGAGIVYIDYPVGEYPRSSTILRQPTHHGGAILYGGLGCTLIARAVFETLPRPWFETTHEYALARAQDGRFILTRTEHAATYGGHDVALAQVALSHGFTLSVVDGMTAGHARLRSWGAQHTNNGAHVVDVLREIEVHHAG